MMNAPKSRLVLLFAAIAVIGASASADVLYTGGTYTQNFDTLISSGTNQPWTNDITLTGWHLFQSAGVAITTYNAGDGASNAGNFYSFGTTGAGERALGGVASGAAYFGSPPSGAVAGHIAVSIQNNTGLTLDNFTVIFDGEQWRNGGNTSAQSMVLEYGFGSTFGGVGTWIAPGGSFDWSSPVTGSTAAAVDGNSAGLVAGVGGTISGLTWNNGDTLWIRWIERNDPGNDHGLAIDNFSFSASSAIPEPGTLAIGLGLLGMAGFSRRRKTA